MNLQPIVEFLSHKGFGIEGENLFRESMPHTVDSGILVTAQMPIIFDHYVPNHRKGQFQVIVRGTSYDNTREAAERVSDELRGAGVTMGELYFHFIHPVHEPLLYPKSDASYIEASVNFDCVFNVI